MPKRTIVYINGYNLYYSRLKNTPYKWLDIVALFRDQILKPQDPSAEVIAVKGNRKCKSTSTVIASEARQSMPLVGEIGSPRYARDDEKRYFGNFILPKYFTAPVMATYARHGARSEQAQTQYLRALKAKYDCIEVINGFHIFEPTVLWPSTRGQYNLFDQDAKFLGYCGTRRDKRGGRVLV